MAAIAKALSRASGIEIETDMLKTIAMFCGVGLLVPLFSRHTASTSVLDFSEHKTRPTAGTPDLGPRPSFSAAYSQLTNRPGFPDA